MGFHSELISQVQKIGGNPISPCSEYFLKHMLTHWIDHLLSS